MDGLEAGLQTSKERITQDSLERIIRELLPSSEIAQFSMDWILSRPEATEESVREVYTFLKSKGLEDAKIATNAKLLGMNPETVERNYKRLLELGLSDSKIAARAELLGMDSDTVKRNYQRLSNMGLRDSKIVTLAQLLGMDPDTVKRNYQRLSEMGLSKSKIAARAELLGMNPETIERNYQRLSDLGLSDSKIAANAQLLGNNPNTVERNYQHYVGLLRQDYQNRASGRDLLTNHAQLLGNSPETIEGNVQFLYNLRVDYNKGLLLGTTPGLKRKKMAWMLRELFDYRTIEPEKRRDAITAMYSFIRADPLVLIKSINTMEDNLYRLREKAAQYKTDILRAGA